MGWDFTGVSDSNPSIPNGSPYPAQPVAVDLDKETRSAYNLFLRQRPSSPPPVLDSLIPEGWGIPPEFSPRYWSVDVPWDEDIPEVFSPLQGTTVKAADPEHLIKPQFDRFFQKTGDTPVSVPRNSMGVLSPVKLSIPYKYNYPEGWGFCSHTPEGYSYILPKSFLSPLTPYSLVMSRGRIKCIEYYKVALTINDTLYLSVVKQHPLDTEKGTNRKVLWCSTVNNFSSEVIPALQEIWTVASVIPFPGQFIVSSGDCLSFKHEYGDLYE